MYSRLRGARVVAAIVGLIGLAILSSVVLTALALFLIGKAIEAEILFISAVVSAIVALLLIFIIFELFALKGNRKIRSQRLATRGLLTQALNGRFLLQQAEETLFQAKRGGANFSLLLLEIDNFKEINTSYGRPGGERVLQALTQACLEITRSTDMVARYNDEEFIMFLPKTEVEEALVIAHRIRCVLSEVPVVVGNTLINFTVSIGVAAYDEGTATVDGLLRRAGRALFNARQHGCNRVEVG